MAKQHEIQKCGICHEGMMHAGGITFFKVSVQYMVINAPAVVRADAMEKLCGSPMIAQALGANEDMAVPLGDADHVWICNECALRYGLAQFHEMIQEAKKRHAEKNSTQQAEGLADAGEHKEG